MGGWCIRGAGAGAEGAGASTQLSLPAGQLLEAGVRCVQEKAGPTKMFLRPVQVKPPPHPMLSHTSLSLMVAFARMQGNARPQKREADAFSRQDEATEGKTLPNTGPLGRLLVAKSKITEWALQTKQTSKSVCDPYIIFVEKPQ